MKRSVALIITLLVLLAAISASCATTPSPPISGEITFETPQKSAHYESNTPAHGAVLAGVPVNIVIDFNFDLGKGSNISITNNGTEYGIGETIIDNNKLAMRRNMDPVARDGVYSVSYRACWPDGSCHDGLFQFAIDRSESQNYTDLRGKGEVTVTMKNISFVPQNIRISQNTKVIWANEDDVEHFVNTDSHPAHTYYPPQNSRGLNKGDSFSWVFDEAGIYPYHCSAHTNMTGSILVE